MFELHTPLQTTDAGQNKTKQKKKKNFPEGNNETGGRRYGTGGEGGEKKNPLTDDCTVLVHTSR